MITALLAGQLTWNIPLFLCALFISIIYLIYVKRNKPFDKLLQPVLFLTGIWMLYLITGSPLLAISYLSFSFHMIQMSFLFFIIPPLVLLGIPASFYEKAIALPFITKIKKLFLAPKVALIAFATLFLLYHFPFFLTILSEHPTMQNAYLAVLFLLSFRMFWPIASPNPKKRIFTEKRKKYVWESSIYIMPACLMFIISGLFDGMNNPFLGEVAAHLCLPAGSDIQLLPPPFNTKYDQMLAGGFMMGLHKAGLGLTCRLEKRC